MAAHSAPSSQRGSIALYVPSTHSAPLGPRMSVRGRCLFPFTAATGTCNSTPPPPRKDSVATTTTALSSKPSFFSLHKPLRPAMLGRLLSRFRAVMPEPVPAPQLIDRVAAKLTQLRANIHNLQHKALKLRKRSPPRTQMGRRRLATKACSLGRKAISVRENIESAEEELRLAVETCHVELQELVWDGVEDWELHTSRCFRVVRWEGPQLVALVKVMQQELAGCLEMLDELRKRSGV